MKTDNINVMANQNLHTKGEWRLSKICRSSIIAGEGETENRIDILCTDPTNTIKAFTKSPSEAECEANAALIVSAVNNNYKLIDALKELNNTATCFADDHKYYYEKGNQNKIDEMLAYFHNAHLKAAKLLQQIESEKQ